MPPSNAARKSCVTKNKGEVPKKTLCLLELTDTMLKTKVELRFQSKVVPNMSVYFSVLYFFTFYKFSFLAAYTVRYWNTTYRRNSMNQTSNKEGFDLVPDPDGFLGWGDRVEPRLGSRVGTRTKAESVSGFLQALFAVTRLRWMKGHATAALGLWMKEEMK